MPGSQINGKSEIREWINSKSDIKVIIDVGCGEGTYPKLLGNKYEYIGIEIWEPYVEKFGLQDLYKEIILSDVRLCSLPEGDCIIFGDILEHLPKKDALKVLTEAGEKYKHLVLSIPISMKKGEIVSGKIHYGNPNEAHVSSWLFVELEKMFKWDRVIFSGGIGVFIK